MAEGKKQCNLYLDEALIKRMKHAAIEAEMRLSDFVADAMTQHLDALDARKETDA